MLMPGPNNKRQLSLRSRILLLIAMLILALAAYLNRHEVPQGGNQNAQTNSSTSILKIQVTTSFYPLYFFTQRIADDKAAVYNITPAGAEPHEYAPTAREMVRIEDSQLLILNGGNLEAWAADITENLRNKEVRVLSVGESLMDQEMVEEGESMRDPHVWLDPLLAKQEVRLIAQGLSQADPANANFYSSRGQQLEQELDALHGEYLAGLTNCAQKNIITAHAAFGYLVRAYGITQLSITGISPEEEPSVQKLAEIADFAREHQVRYIFFESLVSPKLSQTIAQEVGAQTLVLNPIEGLSDEEIRQGHDYFSVMRENLVHLRTALICP